MGAVILFSDGACRPQNPGGCGCWGWVATDGERREIAYGFGALGQTYLGQPMTNNIAEYVAAWKALRWAEAEGLTDPELRLDSQLVVGQTQGGWGCHQPHLKPLRDRLRELVRATHAVLVWVPRTDNERADALTRRAYQGWATTRRAPFAVTWTEAGAHA